MENRACALNRADMGTNWARILGYKSYFESFFAIFAY
jgi:hypothetical protein